MLAIFFQTLMTILYFGRLFIYSSVRDVTLESLMLSVHLYLSLAFSAINFFRHVHGATDLIYRLLHWWA